MTTQAHEHGHTAADSSIAATGDLAARTTEKDSVCGMDVDPGTTPHHATHDGLEYYFCSGGCRTKFVADPDRYLGDSARAEAEAMPGAIWTCPMHPEIQRPGPGSCPICGMALEPEQVSLDDGPDPELIDMTRRFWIGLALTLSVLFCIHAVDCRA